MTHINCFPLEDEVTRAKSLLKSYETNIPENVLRIIEFCVTKKIGFIMSRTETEKGKLIKVFSCKDARSNRIRLGNRGISLFDEFKSGVFKAIKKNGDTATIAAHCRGHMDIDLEHLKEICSLTSIERLAEAELNEQYGMVFGIVNPILIELNSNSTILNVFDESLMSPMATCPGTMMTNAGEHTWGIEFDPFLLVGGIQNKIIAKIAYPEKEFKKYEDPGKINPKSIGIITGNGPESGMTLWKSINKYFEKEFEGKIPGDLALPKVSVISLPAMGLSMELDKRKDATWETLSEAITKLQRLDVDLLCLACHTTHYFTGRIRCMFEHDGKKFISMPETTINYIKAKQLTDIAVLGISFVANLREYSAYSELKELDIKPVPDNILRKFHGYGYEVKKGGDLYSTYQQFADTVKANISAQNIIIALTELSILNQYSSGKTEKNIIDPLTIYAEEIAKQSLSKGV